MGTLERREREKEQRRQTIINAAEKIFFSKGYEKSTMDDVAAECELSKGTLYLYFKSKEEVYLAIILRSIKLLRSMFEKAVDKDVTGLEKVRAIGEAYSKFYFDHRDYYDALMYYGFMEIDVFSHSSAGAELKTFMENKEVMTIFVNAIKEGIKDGTIRKELDPEKTAIILWGQSSGVLQLMTTKGHAIKHIFEYTREEMLNSYFEFTYNALKP
ncbi:MAG: hypothetical protein STSR0008_15650 [Ignavibacterium sp.]